MRVGILQMNSQLNPQVNLAKIYSYRQQIKDSGVKFLFLPEYFYSLSADSSCLTPYVVKMLQGEENTDPHYNNIRTLASDLSVYLLGGTAVTRANDGLLYNRAYNFAPDGTLLATYDKINLFVCNLDCGKIYDEGKFYCAGKDSLLLTISEGTDSDGTENGTERVRIGFSICFDLRFPELFRDLARRGAQLLSVSSAFTAVTGEAHWHLLVRTRAIENQAFVVAAAQWGTHQYGHSLVVDPWGEVLADGGEGEKLLVVDLDLSLIDKVKLRMKVF